MNQFDLSTLLAPPSPRPQEQAFPASSVASLQEQSARRRQASIEVLRPSHITDETGGQSVVNKLIGQYSVWLQEVGQTVIGTTSAATKYLVGFPHNADVAFEDRLASPGWMNAWRENNSYAEKDLAIPATQNGNGHFYCCLKSGQSGSSQPDWKTQSGALIMDGTCIWQETGEVHYFNVTGDDGAKSTPAEKIVACEEVR